MKKIVTAIFATVLASFTAMSMAATVPHSVTAHPAKHVQHVKKVAVKHPMAQHRLAHKVAVKKHASVKHHAQSKQGVHPHRVPAKHMAHPVQH